MTSDKARNKTRGQLCAFLLYFSFISLSNPWKESNAVKEKSKRCFPLTQQLLKMKTPLSKALNPARFNVLSD